MILGRHTVAMYIYIYIYLELSSTDKNDDFTCESFFMVIYM